MSYSATVYRVMIASPGDVAAERTIVREVIEEWNAAHSEREGVVLRSVGWETDAAPSMRSRPQQVINDQVLKDCDLLVAIFWTRIGSPTGKADSGTVEEIEEHIAAGRPAMIYFSDVPASPSSVDAKQHEALARFKDDIKSRGLFESYESPNEFREKFRRQLQKIIDSDQGFTTRAFQRHPATTDSSLSTEPSESPSTQFPEFSLDHMEVKILLVLARDPQRHWSTAEIGSTEGLDAASCQVRLGRLTDLKFVYQHMNIRTGNSYSIRQSGLEALKTLGKIR